MKLLIVCQALDKNHPILGFFHRWVEEFAKNADSVIVFASSVGEQSLPSNVRVYSLGKDEGRGSITRALRLLSFSYVHRKKYDAVFVHMIPEFVLVNGFLWRMLRKKICLWYTHKHVGLRLWLAEKLVHYALTASKASFRLPSKKLQVLGHGIDVDVFSPSPNVQREGYVLSVGRLMKSKRHDLAIQAAKESRRKLHIIGDGKERMNLEQLVKKIGADVSFRGSLPQEALVAEYRKAHALIHTSETGSLDKVVLQALACGCPVVTTDMALEGMPLVVSGEKPDEIASIISAIDRTRYKDMHAYVATHHSLQKLVVKIRGIF